VGPQPVDGQPLDHGLGQGDGGFGEARRPGRQSLDVDQARVTGQRAQQLVEVVGADRRGAARSLRLVGGGDRSHGRGSSVGIAPA